MPEPPYSPGSLTLLPHLHKPDAISEERSLWQSTFQLTENRVQVSKSLAWVTTIASSLISLLLL